MTVCAWCGRSLDGRFDDPTADHLIPASRGGTRHSENLVDACGHCNSRRKSKACSAWYEKCCQRGLMPDGDLILAKLRSYAARPDIRRRERDQAERQAKALEAKLTGR